MNISHSGTFIVIRMLPGKVRHTRTKMPLCFQVRPLVCTTYRTKMLLYSYLYYTFVLDWIHQNNYTRLPYISIKIPGIEFLTLIHWMMCCIRLSTVCIGVRTRETRGASSLPPPLSPIFFTANTLTSSICFIKSFKSLTFLVYACKLFESCKTASYIISTIFRYDCFFRLLRS